MRENVCKLNSHKLTRQRPFEIVKTTHDLFLPRSEKYQYIRSKSFKNMLIIIEIDYYNNKIVDVLKNVEMKK